MVLDLALSVLAGAVVGGIAGAIIGGIAGWFKRWDTKQQLNAMALELESINIEIKSLQNSVRGRKGAEKKAEINEEMQQAAAEAMALLKGDGSPADKQTAVMGLAAKYPGLIGHFLKKMGK